MARARIRILNAIRREPCDESTHWFCRTLAQDLGISKDLVHRSWSETRLEPLRQAVMFCVDETTAMQALNSSVRVMTLSPR